MTKQRSIITPEHFTVSPEILGMPLASPSRRAVAMAIDGLLIVLLVKTGGVFLGLVAGILLFRASAPDPRTGFIRRYVRLALRVAGGLLLFWMIVKGWGKWRDRTPDDEEVRNEAVTASASSPDLKLSASDAVKLAKPILTIRSAEDSTEVANAAVTVLETAKAGGMTPKELQEVRAGLIELMGDKADSSEVGAINAAAATVVGPPAIASGAAPLVRAYLDALDRKDSVAMQEYHDSISVAFAGDQINQLERRAEREDQRADSLDKELDDAKKAHGLRTFLAGFADDLGVGFGWSAVYFTAFLALWRGQTPGKRAARVRVLRLDGKPLGWWLSFERFGGYAASFSVGLIGFFQILWDRNRQGLHDKACETVVVIEPVRSR